MSFGDHLEELRRRLILAIVGVAIVSCGTFYYAKDIVGWLCQPLVEVQLAANIPPGVYNFSTLTGFTTWVWVALISALIISAPWVIYQLWQFIAAGLYPSERRVFSLMAPFSVLLTVLSVLFLYYIMLPAMLAFLIQFSISFPIPTTGTHGVLAWVTHKFINFNTAMSPMSFNLALPKHAAGVAATQATDTISTIQRVAADPALPVDGQIWLNTTDGQLKLFLNGIIRTVSLNSGSLMTPLIGIGEYIDLVLGTALIIAATFQIPVVLGALSAAGLVNPATLAKYRRYVFAGVFILGIFITPSQDVFSDVVIPLMMYAAVRVGAADDVAVVEAGS